VGQATLQSEGCLGAWAFLAAIPAGRGRMEPATFVAELRARLGIPGADQDAWCPRCDGILDVQNYHAGMCAAGGDGLNDGGSALRGRDRVCCCHSRLMTLATQAGDQLIFTFRRWPGLLLHLTLL